MQTGCQRAANQSVFGLVRDALRDDLPVDFLGVIVGFVEVLDFVVTHETAFLIPAFFTPARHHSALRLEARIGLPSTTTKTGFVCEEVRILRAIQLLY